MDKKIPVEIEREYVIEMADPDVLKGQDGYTVSHIEQTYIESELSITHRVRKRVYKDRTVYTETKKVRIDVMSAHEDEREISEGEYLELLKRRKDGTETLIKTRHTFVFLGQTFEVDIYPLWQKSAILETELSSRDKAVVFPGFITVIVEVTGEKKYSNASMSQKFPDELV